MLKFVYIIFLIAILRIRVAFPQAINWPNFNLLRPMQETILEAPGFNPQLYNPQILEAPSFTPQLYNPQILEAPTFTPHLYNAQILESPSFSPQLYNPQILEAAPNIPVISLPPISPISSVSPISPNTATTIITDCSPSVCKNLVNTIQLMIVCNLLQNAQGGSDLAVQLAAPIINEVISSPNFSCGCENPLLPNPISSSVPDISPYFPPPPTIISPDMFSNFVIPDVIPDYTNFPVSNGLFYNLS